MAMARKPLSARNNGQTQRIEGEKAGKRSRYPFCLMNRASLVSALKQVLKPSTTICEDDLMRPVPEKVQQIYFNCLEFVFEVKAESLKLPSFLAHAVGHPELMDDFVYRIQFFKLMKRFMEACLVKDFHFDDLMTPDSKRTCRNLSAIINFIKFHFNVFMEAGCIQEYNETRDQLKAECSDLMAENDELKQQLSALEKQKRDEHDLELELKARINQQEQDMHTLHLQKESLQQQYQEACDQKARSEHRLAELSRELEKWNQRSGDLKKQLVFSPEKLRARLRYLQDEKEEAKLAVKESEVLLRTWESLVSRAHQIPPVLMSLNEDLHRLMNKVEKRNEMQSNLESMEEQIGRQKQVLREATAKHQNLVRHLKLVEDESSRVMYEDSKVVHMHSKEELHRDVCLLEQELQQKEMRDEKLRHNLEVEKEKLAERQGEYRRACTEITDVTEALTKAAHSQFRQYGELMVNFGLDLFKDKDRKE